MQLFTIIPLQINQAFNMVQQRCGAFLSKKDYQRKKSKENQANEPKPFDFYENWIRFSFEELYAGITSHWFWWMIPLCPKKAVERAMTRMEEEWDYVIKDSPRKSLTCGGLLCC